VQLTNNKSIRLVSGATASARDHEMIIITREQAQVLTCNSRTAPGSTVTSAAAIGVETLKVVESIILTEPPGCLVSFTFDHAKDKGLGTCP